MKSNQSKDFNALGLAKGFFLGFKRSGLTTVYFCGIIMCIRCIHYTIGGDSMGIHRVYIEGDAKIVKWLSEHGLRSIDGVVTVIDSSKNHRPVKVIEIDQSKLEFPFTSNDVIKDGKKIAKWRVVEDRSITGTGYLITPLTEKSN